MLKQGSKGAEVERLQLYLDYIFFKKKIDLQVLQDGDFGKRTHYAVRKYQKLSNLKADGIVGRNTRKAIRRDLKRYGTKILVLDAGHGAINPKTGKYTTAQWGGGKLYKHPGTKLHFGKDTFYEGEENREICERIYKRLRACGIYVYKLYHPYKDSKNELFYRAIKLDKLQEWGFYGLMVSIHSNAVSSKYSKAKKDSINGYHCFSTKDGYTALSYLSDLAATIVQKEYDKDSHFKGWMRDKDNDGWDIHDHREANFYILRHAEKNGFVAYLEEAGFFTSEKDAKFLIQERTRIGRAKANQIAVRKILNIIPNRKASIKY